MGFVNMIDKKTNSANVWIRKRLVTLSEMENIKKKAKLIDSVILSGDQEKEIREFFKQNYGKEIPSLWHRLYQSYTGKYHVDYFPELLFSVELEPKTNPYREAEFLCDKSLLNVLFANIPNIHIPKTYISCTRGIIRDENNDLIDQKAAVRIIEGLSSFVIKKTRNTSSGRDVLIYKGQKRPNTILSDFGKDYVVQELITQHSLLQSLNPSSVTLSVLLLIYVEIE